MAVDFRAGPVDGIFDVTLSYGLLYRTESADPDLIAIGNGGNAPNANGDDGTLNYDTGLISNTLAANTELTLDWNQWGAFARVIGFYDFETENGDREHRDFDSDTLDTIGSDIELRDAYLTGRFSPGGMPVILRVGDQVINWGESNFVRDGLDLINPLDVVGVFQPARSARDARVPQGMIWGAAGFTETFAIEGYYQYDWEGVNLPAVGSFFSTNDLVGVGTLSFAQFGMGQYSDLGTDLDEAFGLPAGTLGFDEQFFQAPHRFEEEPDDGGQYGFALTRITQGANALKWGLHFIRYHSRLPIISGLTADQDTIDMTEQSDVDVIAAQLAPIYEAEGLSPEEAADTAEATAGELVLSNYANNAGYYTEFPEDITMVALSFNTALARTGTLVSGEASFHDDFPFQISLQEVFNGVASPVQFDPSFSQGALGSFGASQRVPGFTLLDRTQAALGLLQVFPGRFGAAQTLISLDAAYIHIHSYPNADEPQLNAPGGGDADSWGYRLLLQQQYASVFGGLNLFPRIAFTHDVSGFTPAPLSAFAEDRKSFSIGVSGNYINRWTGDLSYTTFFGGEPTNNLIDRDFIRLQINYGF